MSGDLTLRWSSPGPVASAFMRSTAPVQGIMGPIGSGKTSTVLLKFFRIAAAQAPSPIDGIRKVRFAVVRDTYRQLWKTTMPSWFAWVPRDKGEFTGGTDGPASHRITFAGADGIPVQVQVDFVAIGENAVEDVLRGYEVTGFYLNEADRLAEDVLTYCRGRVGRYPTMRDGGPTWYGILLDYNAPDIESYLYRIFEEERPAGHEFFRQPSGLAPNAENLKNLPPGYYANQMQGQPDWYIRRMIRNEYGYSRDGQPVYPEFNDTLHVAGQILLPDPRLDLVVGLDAGLTPAASFRQRMPNGQQRTIDELVTEDGAKMGPSRFAEALNQRLRERYPQWRPDQIRAVADPACFYGGDGEEDPAWASIVAGKTGLSIRPAETNAIAPRQDAVRLPMTQLIDGHYPGWIVSPHCRTIVKGYAALYRYRKLQVAGEARFAEQVDKNHHSHVADADQYAAMACGDFQAVMGRKSHRQAGRAQSHAKSSDNPAGQFHGRGNGRRQGHAINR